MNTSMKAKTPRQEKSASNQSASPWTAKAPTSNARRQSARLSEEVGELTPSRRESGPERTTLMVLQSPKGVADAYSVGTQLITDEMGRLQSTNKHLENELRSLNKQIANYRRDLQALKDESEKQQLDANIAQSTLEVQCAELQMRNDKLERELDAKTKRLEVFEEEMRQKKTEEDKLDAAKYKTAKKRLHELKRANQKLERNLEGERTSRRNYAEALKLIAEEETVLRHSMDKTQQEVTRLRDAIPFTLTQPPT